MASKKEQPEVTAEPAVTKTQVAATMATPEKFTVHEIIRAHERFGYTAELIAVALDGCTELTKAEAEAKIKAFAKKEVKKGVK